MLLMLKGQFDRYINKPDVIAKMYPGRTFDFLAMNLSNPILKSKEIRQAIALCLDKSKIMDETILERVVPSDMPIIPESWIYGDNNPSQYLINMDEVNNVIILVEED